MARTRKKFNGISPDYDKTNILKTIQLPSEYIEYLRRVRACSGGSFESFTDMVRYALSAVFPSPDLMMNEDEHLIKLFGESRVKQVNFFGEENSFSQFSSESISSPENDVAYNEEIYSTFCAKLYKVGSEKFKLQIYDKEKLLYEIEFKRKDFDTSEKGRKGYAKGVVYMILTQDNDLIEENDHESVYEMIEECLAVIV